MTEHSAEYWCCQFRFGRINAESVPDEFRVALNDERAAVWTCRVLCDENPLTDVPGELVGGVLQGLSEEWHRNNEVALIEAMRKWGHALENVKHFTDAIVNAALRQCPSAVQNLPHGASRYVSPELHTKKRKATGQPAPN